MLFWKYLLYKTTYYGTQTKFLNSFFHPGELFVQVSWSWPVFWTRTFILYNYSLYYTTIQYAFHALFFHHFFMHFIHLLRYISKNHYGFKPLLYTSTTILHMKLIQEKQNCKIQNKSVRNKTSSKFTWSVTNSPMLPKFISTLNLSSWQGQYKTIMAQQEGSTLYIYHKNTAIRSYSLFLTHTVISSCLK